MTRNRVVILLAVAIVASQMFCPLSSLDKLPQRTVNLPPVDAELLTVLGNYIQEHPRTPEQYILDSFREHEIVFLGEFWKVKQNLVFVAGLIPFLYADGITNMGVEFALYQDQELIDALLTGPEYSEETVRQLLFNYLMIWGYQESADLFKAVWEFNHSLTPGAVPFRLVGLSVKQDFHYIQTVDDVENPEVLKKVYVNGIPDVYIAEVIRKEFIDPQVKALIFSHIHTGVTRFKYQIFRERMEGLDFADVRKAGQYIYEDLGAKTMTILLHAPFPNNKSISGIDYPVGGAIDVLLASLPPEQQRLAFSTVGSPFGNLIIQSESYALGYQTLELQDFCDGYIVLVPLGALEIVTPIKDFINDSNIDEAAYNFIGPKNQKLTLKNLNDFILEDIEGLQRLLDQFE